MLANSTDMHTNNVVDVFPGPDFETTQFPTDPLEDQAILDGMEPEYYEDNFDPSEHELKV